MENLGCFVPYVDVRCVYVCVCSDVVCVRCMCLPVRSQFPDNNSINITVRSFRPFKNHNLMGLNNEAVVSAYNCTKGQECFAREAKICPTFSSLPVVNSFSYDKHVIVKLFNTHTNRAVSYTHLTLPTSDGV